MEIRVLKTTTASKNQNGTQCFKYLQGEIYDIYDELAEVFLKEGWGEKVIEDLEKKAIKELENKAINNLENKQFKIKKVNKNAE